MAGAVLAGLMLVAANGATGAETAAAEPATDKTWTLATDDTELSLSVASNTLSIVRLRNPAQNWNWTPAPSPVPLPGVNGKKVEWTFRDAAETKTNGHEVTLRFTCADPALELKSVWRARPGVGPVEHQPTIRNNSTGAVAFVSEDLVAADLKFVSDQAAHVFPVAAGTLGYGEGLPLPFQMLQVGKEHGVYLAYDYGCGKFATTVTSNQIASRWWADGITNTATATGETFRCPGIMIQTYQGDEDDGANHFRRWFWLHEITRSLYNNPNDPPIEFCEWPYYDGKPDALIERIKTKNYAAWGVGLWKTDFWHMRTGHARSAELAEVCHSNGLQLCLYWNGSPSEEKLVAEWNKSKFDYYRTDSYGSHLLNMNYYHEFMAFNRKIDSLFRNYGIKYENCSNGGSIRSLDVFRRMTFMTHSDQSNLLLFFRHVNDWSYLMCPLQIKNDYPIGCHGVGESVAELRGMLLGSILSASTKVVYDFINEEPTELDPTTIGNLKRVFALYNTRQRAILRGTDVYHILPSPAGTPPFGQWFGLQYYNTFINKGSVLLWQNGGPASQVIKLKGLDRGASYELGFEDATENHYSRTGAQLMDEGVTVPMGANASEIIWINFDVTAAIRVDSTMGEQPLPVRFDGSKSFCASGKLVSYDWDFGDGTTARQAVASHTYQKPGAYEATLTVRDEQKRSDVSRVTITVAPVDDIAPTLVAVPPRRTDQIAVMFSEPVQQADAETIANYTIIPGVHVLAASLGTDRKTVSLTTSPLSSGEYTLTVKNIRDCARKPNMIAANTSKAFGYPLFARWKLDEGKGLVAADAGGSKLDGTLKGGVAWTNAAGRKALSFDGASGIVEMPTMLEDLAVPFSLTLWVNPAAEQMRDATILSVGDSLKGGLWLTQIRNTTNIFQFGYSNGNHWQGTGLEQLTAGQWQHVAVVCDGSKAFFYVNGEVKSSHAAGVFAPSLYRPFRLGIGILEDATRFFKGLLSDVRIYRTALSPAEVQAVMKE